MQIEAQILDDRLRDAGLSYGSELSAGLDLRAAIEHPLVIVPNEVKLIPTGIKLNMTNLGEDLMAIIVPRSGKGHKEGKVLGNLIGIIDQDYQGELMVSLWNRNKHTLITIEPMERFAQLIFVPIFRPQFKFVEYFTTRSVRGSNGFGSTGHE